MSVSFWEKYKLERSGKFAKLLGSQHARKFIAEVFEFASNMYYKVFLLTLPELDEPGGRVRLDLELLVVALESAYLDLQGIENAHDLSDGPEPERIAGAIVSWINKVRPIQLLTNETFNGRPIINSVFSVLVGWAFLWCERHGTPGVDFPPEKIGPLILEAMNEGKMFTNDALYHVAWRNPGHKELAFLFKFNG